MARNSSTNGALIAEMAASDPALNAKYRDAALTLATAYPTQAAAGYTPGSIQGGDGCHKQQNLRDAGLVR